MSISIVIRAFNEDQHIGQLLYGITKQTFPNPEIILVDSGSTDETLSIAGQYPVKVTHIEPNNFTFGRSLNTGIAAATGEYIVITSAHCYPVYPDWLEKLTQPLNNQDIALTYGKQRGGETNHYCEHQFFRKYFPDHSINQQSQPYSHNANAAIRRKLWEQHPYDETLTGLEDLAWSSWAMESGFEIAYIAEAEVVHLHDETYAQIYNRFRRESIALKQILPNSHFSIRQFIHAWIRNVMIDFSQARRDQLLRKQAISIFKFRLMQYWATYRGYHFGGKIDQKLHQTFYYPPGNLDHKTSKPRKTQSIDYRKI